MIKKILKKCFSIFRDKKIDSSLRGQAFRRATHLDMPNSGTPHDWEDWEKYQQLKHKDK